MQAKEKINSLQYLRAIAAILVVYSHCLSFIGNGKSYQALFYYLKSFGAIGVDIFFVISGFIISYVSLNMNGGSDAIAFIKKRFIRINPNYYIASALALGLRFISKPNSSFSRNEILLSLTILPISTGGVSRWKPILYVGWTLAYEWLFYLIFAFFIAISIRKKRLCLVIFFIIFSLAGIVYPMSNVQYNFISNPLTLEFCLGIAIATFFTTFKRDIPLYCPLLLIGLGLLWYSIIIKFGYGFYDASPTNSNLIHYWNRFAQWGLPSSMIVFGVVLLERKRHISFDNRIWLLLGDASFSIYLVHTILISLINKFFNHLNFIPLDILVIFAVCMSIAVSILYYKVVEIPLLKYFNSILLKKSVK